MDWGDILYGVAILVAIVISTIRKAAKNSHRPYNDIPVPEQEIEDTLKEFFPTMQQTVVETEEHKTASPPAYQKQGSVSQFSNYQKNNFKRQRIKEKGTISSSLKKRVPQEKFLKEDEENNIGTISFDLQKAVIYSEILKRPDY